MSSSFQPPSPPCQAHFSQYVHSTEVVERKGGRERKRGGRKREGGERERHGAGEGEGEREILVTCTENGEGMSAAIPVNTVGEIAGGMLNSLQVR